jgi:hypothetical protein
MPSAQRRHFGSVRKLPSGRYQARYWHLGESPVAPSTFATKADALAWSSGAETDIHRGAWTAPKAGKTSLSEYARGWLGGRSDLRPVRRSKYGHMLERHVIMGTSTLNRVWQRARKTIGRTDVFLHDLRHSGLTWAAASGASVAVLMRRGGHANPRAALRYQHATEDRDRAIADALAALAVRQPTPDTRPGRSGTPRPPCRRLQPVCNQAGGEGLTACA